MIFTNKLLPVALIAALVGGSVGALVMHSRNQTATAETTAANQAADAQKNEAIPAEFNTPAEQTAYKTGFADGYNAAQTPSTQRSAVTSTRTRYVARNVVRSSPRRVYYDYSRPQGRSFWQKHR